MNVWSFGLDRTGYGGPARDSNVAMAQNFFCSFLKCDKVQLMGKEEEKDRIKWSRLTTFGCASITLPPSMCSYADDPLETFIL